MLRHTIDTLLVQIPSECPMARDIQLFGKVYHFKPCKLNPFYDSIMEAKFHAMERLAAH